MVQAPSGPDPLPRQPEDARSAPHRPADATARALARTILRDARHATLAVLDAEGWPMTSRIAFQCDEAGLPLALLSDLALHTRCLRRDPRAALLVDGPSGDRGWVLNRARLSLQLRAVPADPALRAGQAARWRDRDPKAAVTLGLADFRFWRLDVRGGLLNAGFGRAFLMTAADLVPGSD